MDYQGSVMSERARTAATPEYLYTDFRPGQRVRSVEGFPGTVQDVLEGPGNNTVIVTLDNGIGGGEYGDDELTPLNLTDASGHDASVDYPELGSILTERPDLQASISEDDYLGRTASILQAHQHRTAEWTLSLPLDLAKPAESNQPSHGDPGYTDGFTQAQQGSTREPASADAAYRTGFAAGWADGVMNRPPEVELPKTDPADLATEEDGSARLGSLEFEAGMDFRAGLWGLITDDKTPTKTWAGPGHNWSFDACRFRHNSRCMYPKELNKDASEQAGYAVWVPEDRGYCSRIKWDDQKTCKLYEPGPHIAGGLTDATVPWEEGGQHGGHPVSKAGHKVSSDSFGWHFTAAWKDVRAKAKRIRSSGKIRVLSSMKHVMAAQVQGDHHVYQVEVHTVPDRYAVSHWVCGCAWAAYSWGRTGPWKKYEGRMCSHALATVYEAQSRGMFGKVITEDEVAPAWVDKSRVKIDGDWSRDLGRYSQRSQFGNDPWKIVEQMLLTGVPVVKVHQALLAMGVTQHVASTGPLQGQVDGEVKDLVFDSGKVLDGEREVVGPILYPTYSPNKGLDFTPVANPNRTQVATKTTTSCNDDEWALEVESANWSQFKPVSEGVVEFYSQQGRLQGTITQNDDHLYYGLTPGGNDTSTYPTQMGAAYALEHLMGVGVDSFLGEDQWALTADLHSEPEPALPATDGDDHDNDDDHQKEAVKDPHAWLLKGSGKDDDVAGHAKQFLATKNFSAGERAQIIGEGEGSIAGNLGSLDLTGTHYQAVADVDDEEMGFF